jgi:hypothetical protein
VEVRSLWEVLIFSSEEEEGKVGEDWKRIEKKIVAILCGL